jgi:hypothetical protein
MQKFPVNFPVLREKAEKIGKKAAAMAAVYDLILPIL